MININFRLLKFVKNMYLEYIYLISNIVNFKGEKFVLGFKL